MGMLSELESAGWEGLLTGAFEITGLGASTAIVFGAYGELFSAQGINGPEVDLTRACGSESDQLGRWQVPVLLKQWIKGYSPRSSVPAPVINSLISSGGYALFHGSQTISRRVPAASRLL